MQYAILLRGINVGGHNKLPMADLRASLTKAGYDNVRTYIQSGNVVVDSASKVISADIAKIVEADFGLAVPVVVHAKKQIVDAISNNPFHSFDARRLHVLYLSKSVRPASVDKIDAAKFSPDEFAIVKSHAYVRYSENSWSSKLTIEVFENAFGLTATARNWNTASKLVEMMT